MIRTALLCVAVVLIAGAIITGRARGQDGRHGLGHAQHHDSYQQIKNPATGMRCCNAKTEANPDGDCRPGAVWRDAGDNLIARIDGRQFSVPEAALLPSEMNPHPPVGLICEKNGIFYCVAMSGTGG